MQQVQGSYLRLLELGAPLGLGGGRFCQDEASAMREDKERVAGELGVARLWAGRTS